MINIRQIRSVVAVVEEGSFTAAALRENATQSGISQHVAAVEQALGVKLFERGADGVRVTPAGRRYYTHAVEGLRGLELAGTEAQASGRGISGAVRAGLMPAFTRAALAPALEGVTRAHPDIEVRVVEGYSGMLTDMVRRQELDFALVPASASAVGLDMSHLARDREMLMGRADGGLDHGQPVRLADLPPLKLIAPSRNNIRRARLEDYCATHGARIERVLEMDAMMGTLELVACSDWMTILPGLICEPDRAGSVRQFCPIEAPPLFLDFVVIQPARKPLSPQAEVFLEAMRRQVAGLVTT